MVNGSGGITTPSDHSVARTVAEHPLRFVHRAVAQYELLDDGTVRARFRLDVTTPPIRLPQRQRLLADQVDSGLCPLPVAVIPKFSVLSGLTIEDDRGRKLPPLNRRAGLELTADLLVHRVQHLAAAQGLSVKPAWEPAIRAVAVLAERPRETKSLPYVEVGPSRQRLTSAREGYHWLEVHTQLTTVPILRGLLQGAQKDSLLYVVLDDVTQWRRRLITVRYWLRQPIRRSARGSLTTLRTLPYQMFVGLGVAPIYYSHDVATSYAESHHVEITAPTGAMITDVESVGPWHGTAETSITSPSRAQVYYPRGEFPPGRHPISDRIVVGLRVPFRGWFRVAILSALLQTILLISLYFSLQRVFDGQAKEWVAASLIALAAIQAGYLTASRARLAQWSADQLFLVRWVLRVNTAVGLAFAWALLLQRPPDSRLYMALTWLSLIPTAAYLLYVLARSIEILATSAALTIEIVRDTPSLVLRKVRESSVLRTVKQRKARRRAAVARALNGDASKVGSNSNEGSKE